MNERGFTLIEMLVSLSILIMISTFITPTLMEVLIDRKDLSLRNEGSVLLIDQMNQYYTYGKFTEEIDSKGVTYAFYKDGNRMYVTWKNQENKQEISSYEVAY